jgi:hypothetical protein
MLKISVSNWSSTAAVVLAVITIWLGAGVSGSSVDVVASSSQPQPGALYNDASVPAGPWKAIAGDDTGQYLAAITIIYCTTEYTCEKQCYVVFTSSNFGVSWQQTSVRQGLNCYQPDTTHYFVTSDSTGRYLTAGTYQSNKYLVFVSIDYGISWFPVAPVDLISFMYEAVSDSSGQYLIGSTSKGILTSSTYGFTWEKLLLLYGAYSVACNSDFSFLAVASCEDGWPRIELWRNQVNAGWYNTFIGLDAPCSSIVLVNDDSGEYLTIATGNNLLRSVDYGDSWYFVNNRSLTASGLTGHESYFGLSNDGSGQRLLVSAKATANGENRVYASYSGGAMWIRISVPSQQYNYSYKPLISPNGLFMAMAVGKATTSLDGSIWSNTKTDLYLTGTIQPNSATGYYTFTNMGYVGGTIYLTLVLRLSYMDSATNSELIVLSGNNGNILDGAVLYRGRCSCRESCIDQANEEYIQCAVNIEVNNSYFNASGIQNSSFAVVATMTSATEPSPCAHSSEVDNVESFYYLLQLLLTSVPQEKLAPAAVYVSIDELTVIVLPCVAAILSLFGYVLYRQHVNRDRLQGPTVEDYDKASILLVIWRFGTFGFQISTEFWLYCALSSCFIDDLYYLRILSYAIVIVRACHCLPTSFVWTQLCFGAPDMYSKFIDAEWMLSHRCVESLMMFLSLGNVTLLRYYPWTGDQVTRRPFLGFPNKRLLDLCSSCTFWFEGISLVAQTVLISRTNLSSLRGSNFVVGGVAIAYFSISMLKFIEAAIISWTLKWNQEQRSTFGQLLIRDIGSVSGSALMTTLKSKCRKMFNSRRIPLGFILLVVKFALALSGYCIISSWGCTLSRNSAIAPPHIMSYFVAAVAAYAVALGMSLTVFLCCDTDFDSHEELIYIAKSYSLDATKISKLLQFTTATYSLVEVFCVCSLTFVTLFRYVIMSSCLEHDDYYAENTYDVDNDPFTLLTTVVILDLLSPVIVLCTSEWRQRRKFQDVIFALIRVDVWAMTLLFKLMLCCVYPLSFLSSMSMLKAHWTAQQDLSASLTKGKVGSGESDVSGEANIGKDGMLLSFQLRDNWKETDDEVDGNAGTTFRWITLLIRRLSKRFTVVYSFAKLCGAILFTVFVSRGYQYCANPGQYHDGITCPITYETNSDTGVLEHSSSCFSSCFDTAFPPRITYPSLPSPDCPPLPPSPWECNVSISNECLCSNWVVFQLVIIILHVVHYGVQCYFYIRYNYFDPQQNQINCVETYAFAGDNLMLFLTHPWMCFLSVLEAAAIVIVWVDVVLPPNAFCGGSYTFNMDKLPFAAFITFLEVYKANASTFLKLSKNDDFWWALWSLIRIDLFVFYGLTLFLQTFFFPFSLVGHTVSAYRLLSNKDMDLELEDETLDKTLISEATIHGNVAETFASDK